MIRKILLIFTAGILLTSCIPTKDLIYFQGEPSANASVHKMMNEPYRLQVNDILDIRLKSEDQKLVALFNQSASVSNVVGGQINPGSIYFNSYTIDRRGNIRLPYVDEINVLGYTEKEVREKIQVELGKYFKDINSVFVTVKLAGIRLTLVGEVENPGTLVLFQNEVNIIEAIANAGDIKLTGNRKKVTVLRKSNERTQKFNLDLTNISIFKAEPFYVQSNDIIYVEPLKQKSWGTGTTGAQTFTTLISLLSLVTTSILLVRTL